MKPLLSFVLPCCLAASVSANEHVRVQISHLSAMADFCLKQTPVCIADKPDPGFYNGQEGTLLSEKPVAKGLDSNIYAIDMDSGARIYYFAKPDQLYNPKNLIRLDYDSRDKPEPLTSDGEITFIKGATADGLIKYKLSTGVELFEAEFQTLISTLALIPEQKQTKFVSLMEGFVLEFSSEDEITLVKLKEKSGLPHKERLSLKPYVILEKQSAFLHLVLQYTGSNWVYATGADIQSGEETLALKNLNFIREEDNGVLYERYERQATRADLKALYKVLSNEDAVVRFIGSRYKSTRPVKDEHREQLRKLLDLYSLLS